MCLCVCERERESERVGAHCACKLKINWFACFRRVHYTGCLWTVVFSVCGIRASDERNILVVLIFYYLSIYF